MGLTTGGEISLAVSTSRDGIVTVEAGELHADEAHDPAPYAAAQAFYVAAGDPFAEAAPLPVPDSFMPTTGQTFDLAGATLEAGEPVAGCDPTAVGSLWYRIQRPGTLRRIKLRADVPLAVGSPTGSAPATPTSAPRRRGRRCAPGAARTG